MKVLKFGGSSVENAGMMRKVAKIVSSACRQETVILVCSAVKGCTDALIALGQKASAGDKSAAADGNAIYERHLGIIAELLPDNKVEAAEAIEEFREVLENPFGRTPDEIVSLGELLSTRIIAEYIRSQAHNTKWIDSRRLVLLGPDGTVDVAKSYPLIQEAVASAPECEVFVAPGFIASDHMGRACTLGRGGSDYTAALFAEAVGARMVEIWTDVPGIMTADPRLVPAARTIPYLSYDTAHLMAEYGAKVLYPPTVVPAMRSRIPICILDTFAPDLPGSLIMDNPPRTDAEYIGVTAKRSGEDYEIALIGNGSDEVKVIPCKASEYRETLSSLHRTHFESKKCVTVGLYIAGWGAVAKALADLISRNSDAIAERSGKRLRIIGVANTSRYIIDADGIAPEDVERRLLSGEKNAAGAFLDCIGHEIQMRTVLVDCTSSEDIGSRYEECFRRGIDVVSCNRRAFAVPYARYKAMKDAARDYGRGLRYGTTVGAALPLLETIASSEYGSERISSIEAVVSCTLNLLFSSYDGTESFAKLLREAQKTGLTEKDPRMDLSGLDAERKILILARETGVPLESKDIEIEPFPGKEYFEGSVEEFYKRLEAAEPQIREMFAKAAQDKLRWRFVASLEKDSQSINGYRARIRMQAVGEDHPFYRLYGTDNVTVIRTGGQSSPLIIQGAGEGAYLAASGVINDVLML